MLFFLPILLTLFFVVWYFTYKRSFPILSWPVEAVAVIGYPIFFLTLSDTATRNSCCDSDEIFFAPSNRITAYAFIALFVGAYGVSRFLKKTVLSPILEVALAGTLIAGFVFTIFINIHLGEWTLVLIGGLQAILWFILRITDNYLRIREQIGSMSFKSESWLIRKAHHILTSAVWIQYPFLVVFAFPVLFVLLLILLLFGQQPDAIITAFTQTYDYGFSTLECVPCSECYLCTIGTKGHSAVVKANRRGIRSGHVIPINRQILVFNSFETILAKRVPFIHRPLRVAYGVVGRSMSRLHSWRGGKWMADGVYLMLKPLQWMFAIMVYTVYSRPENVLSAQYLAREHRLELERVGVLPVG